MFVDYATLLLKTLTSCNIPSTTAVLKRTLTIKLLRTSQYITMVPSTPHHSTAHQSAVLPTKTGNVPVGDVWNFEFCHMQQNYS